MENLKGYSFRNAIVFVFIFGIIGASPSPVFGQLRLVPASYSTTVDGDSREATLRNAAVALPFFDDFSTVSNGRPDVRYWEGGSGVRINNTLTNGQPSVNVATFDGLNGQGSPYNFTNPLLQSFTDTLTSQPIDLSGKVAADSIYLSFYWQGGSLIEKPDSSDYVQLEFFSKDLQWQPVWKQTGYQTDSLFHQKFVVIKDSQWMHANFRFRFRSYGRSSGSYDMWHIDYVYLNSKRSSKDPYIRDLALTRPLSPLLNTFRAMPLSHFRIDPNRYTATQVTAELRNLNNNENRTSWTFQIQDQLSGGQFPGDNEGSTYIGPLQAVQKTARVAALKPAATAKALKLKYGFKVQTSDNQNPSIPTIDLTRNDTLSATAVLDDYFAYDDGSAEYGIQINQKLGRVAVRYVLAQPDTIGGVRMSILPFNKDIAGLSFTLQLWSNRAGRPDVLLAQNAFPASYTDSSQTLKEYAFSKAIALTDTFYVGWLQVNEQPLTVGYDLNSQYGAQQVQYNLGNHWASSTDLRGSIMIRPYLAKSGAEVVTALEPTPVNGYFYPNPSSGLLQWKGEPLEKVEVYDVSGRRINAQHGMESGEFIDIQELSQGIYYFKAYTPAGGSVQKILKHK